jgi:redox-sensing transcriptional repressor
MKNGISNKTIGRLSLYRRALYELFQKNVKNVFSHQLASSSGVTPAQLRRDLMSVRNIGSPQHGYSVEGLIESISNLLDASEPQLVGLVGAGNLGRAIIAYFAGRRPKLQIVAAFDKDPNKTHRLMHGCKCYPIEELPTVFSEKGITIGIITVPAEEAQGIAELLVRAGAKGIMNFAPSALRLPREIHVENMDVTTSLEKLAYFARN